MITRDSVSQSEYDEGGYLMDILHRLAGFESQIASTLEISEMYLK